MSEERAANASFSSFTVGDLGVDEDMTFIVPSVPKQNHSKGAAPISISLNFFFTPSDNEIARQQPTICSRLSIGVFACECAADTPMAISAASTTTRSIWIRIGSDLTFRIRRGGRRFTFDQDRAQPARRRLHPVVR